MYISYFYIEFEAFLFSQFSQILQYDVYIKR